MKRFIGWILMIFGAIGTITDALNILELNKHNWDFAYIQKWSIEQINDAIRMHYIFLFIFMGLTVLGFLMNKKPNNLN
jgi:hypothetical protein